MIYDKNVFRRDIRDFLLVFRRVDRYFEKCYLFFQFISSVRHLRLSSSSSSFFVGGSIKVRTQSPLNLGSGAQNGNVRAEGPD